MFKIHRSDSERIVRSTQNAVDFHLENDRPLMAAKAVLLAFQDLWLSSREYEAHLARQRWLKRVRQYNFETEVYNDLDTIPTV